MPEKGSFGVVVCCVLWGLNLSAFVWWLRSVTSDCFSARPTHGECIVLPRTSIQISGAMSASRALYPGRQDYLLLGGTPCVFFLLGKGFVFILLFWICIALLDLHTVNLHTVYVCVWCKFVSICMVTSLGHIWLFIRQRDPHTGNVFSWERHFGFLEQWLYPEPFTQGDRS